MIAILAGIGRFPIAWVRSLFNLKELLKKRPGDYSGFVPRNAISYLFYKTQWINLSRYGRGGVSPILGLGHYPLTNWFHLSLFASMIYAAAPALTTVFGTLFLIFSHLAWIDTQSWWWVMTLMAIYFSSGLCYGYAFSLSNYQVIGWALFPLACCLLIGGNIAASAVIWAAISIIGITQAFFGLLFVSVWSGLNESAAYLPLAIVILVPQALNLVTLILDGDGRKALLNTARMIGLLGGSRSKYRRSSMTFRPFTKIFLSQYILSIIIFWLGYDHIPYLIVAATLIFVVNQMFFRFADDQGAALAVALFAFIEIVMSPPSVFGALALFFVLIVVPPHWQIYTHDLKVRTFYPFNHRQVTTPISNFFARIPIGSKVLNVFSDPKGIYERIFDGQRYVLEAFLYVAAEKGIHLFPDWYAVAETTSKDSESIFFETIDSALDYAKRNSFDFLILRLPKSSVAPKSLGQFALHESFITVSIVKPELDWHLYSLSKSSRIVV